MVGLVAFVTTADNTVLAAAAPSIGREIGAGVGGLQWLTLGYLLPFAGLLPAAGPVLDRWGARRTLAVALVVFAAGAVLGGCVRDVGWLVAARVVQGLAAAFLVPGTLSLLRITTDEKRRVLGAALWTAALAVALAVGPLAGGVLSEYLHWSWIFFANVPFALAAAALLPLCGSGEVTGRQRAPELASLVAACLALVLLTFAVTGTGTPWVPWSLAAAGALAAVFTVRRERTAAAPLIPRALRGTGYFTGGLAVQLLWGVGVSGIVFFTPLVHQETLGLDPVAAALPLVAVAGALVLATPLVPRALARFGPRRTVACGLTTVALGLLAVAVAANWPSIPPRLPGLMLAGAGSAFTVPLTSSALDEVPGEHAGTASALLTASREVSSALGVVVIGVVLTSWPGDGYVAGLVVAAAAELCAAWLALRVFRPSLSPRHHSPSPMR
ncbi:MFS transporter [Amycolatopsis sp. H20-H5]|uniref:MFS transporter n=1 Tax=Amycolatopsis sp. H20-H5 TaxID=3046309 RepID=UPI003FA3A6F1